MQCLLLPLIDEPAWLGLTKEEQDARIAAFPPYLAALKEAGVLVGAYRPQPSVAAKTVRVADGETQVADGPHAKTKDQLGGVYVVDVPDLDAALAWAARSPVARYGVVEVRPIASPRP
jgi:hypothetical protein